MKKMTIFTTLVLSAFILVGGESDSISSKGDSNQTLLEQIQKEGVIQIGTEGAYAPYSYHDETGKLVGYDVEVAEAVAEKLGVEVEFVETDEFDIVAGLDKLV